MDTGSGKTQVAVMRMRGELEREDPNKIIWFLARTVALCSQQHDVIKTQIPVTQTRLLLGSDNVDAWSDQETWDTILLNTRIVVSTPQILYDALSHAFVTMQRLSLIVFDEAHHCVKNDVGKRIMEKFYHDNKGKGLPVPHILGLTASPIMGSRSDGLEMLEKALDAVCKSPTIHRGELMSHVKKPALELAYYESKPVMDTPRSLLSLRATFQGLDILEDPYVLHLANQGTDRSLRKLERVLDKWDTYTQNQLKTFTYRSSQLLRELGSWAAEYYVWKVTEDAKSALVTRDPNFVSWTEDERQYLAKALNQIKPVKRTEADLTRDAVSEKVVLLMEHLLLGDDDTLGIVFVKERTTATLLAHLLATHPLTRHKYPRVGVVVGVSQYAARKKDIWDLSRTEEFQSLQRFRDGEINLLVATNVLEEGIDVPACNLVICFDPPDNLKSFIQRRGRARQKDSRLVILVDLNNPPKLLQSWEQMEAQMKSKYEDQDRELERLRQIEDSEPTPSEILVVESTGAQIDYDTAKSHLEHFCATLSPDRYVDSQPDFIIQNVWDGDSPLLKATVLLPSYVPEAVRIAESRNAWLTEKNAIKDAAFQAYAALYTAKLLNDHLLPLKAKDMMPSIERRPKALVSINGLVNPWVEVARAWENPGVLWATPVRFMDPHGICRGSYSMITPIALPELPPTLMYIERGSSHWTVEFGAQHSVPSTSTIDHASVLLALPFSHRWPSEDRRHVVRFVSEEGDLTIDQLGAKPFDVDEFMHQDSDSEYLIRDFAGCPYKYEKVLEKKPSQDQVQRAFRGYGDMPGFVDAPDDVAYLALKKWSRRIDFLHRETGDPTQEQASTKPYARVFPLPWARVDSIPSRHALFGACIPSILHHVEVRMVAKQLSCSVIRDLSISDLSLVVDAISSRSAREPGDYERLEFFGDSLLKMCATINVAALHLDLPEGYLALMKDCLVSNSRLCKAAVESGLDKFLLTRPFTGNKWRPIYVDALLDGGSADSGPRQVSSKTLADIVEALIGAVHADGGLSRSLSCIALFLPDIEWHRPDECRKLLYDHAPSDVPLPPTLAPLEDLLGYQFRKKALLVEATTHASYHGVDSFPLRTLERLEFLGDAVLDYIVVSRLYPLNLPPSATHLLKSATVNGDLLGFLALEHHIDQDKVIVSTSGGNSPIGPESPPPSPFSTPVAAMETDNAVGISDISDLADEPSTPSKKPTLKHEAYPLPLWKFLRHNSPNITAEQPSLEHRHAALRSRILAALRKGTRYPWALLARLRTPKFVSDQLEAVLGAVWVDSGDLSACEAVAARFGILGVLDRLISDGVHVLHPKEELGRLADQEKVKYIVTGVDGSDDEGNGVMDENEGVVPGVLSAFGGKNWQCRIMVGTRCVVELDGGVSREEVETKAAEVAVKVLVEEKKQRAAKNPGVGCGSGRG
ncbi:RNase3 domain-containing protein [Sodiomyces alkalinus F11]|uniref:RNase3 domain-containing protein n=1 Tax=Sodiomyces alkalinus (strain CBS 110278 / VKM F-3762 / F11) TaxID=1314773 RepID=A0A3N2Q9E8_SODAK|nr:RNase3 domain-containing protein [Sodiomyces alkalinus F11]ROT43265.1 RNase3 domain-containing protein [Sodiomyces alkalinus F11]